MKKIIINVIGTIIGTIVVLVLILALMTPYKTDKGTFTDPWKYWTDDGDYICENFNDAECTK